MRLVSRRPILLAEAPTSSDIADDCEAFLRSDLAARWRETIGAPVWTWLNAVAHGDVRALAVRPVADGDVEGRTTRTIARAILGDGREVELLQREVLVPLELSVAGQVMIPRRLVELVTDTLFGVAVE